MSETSLVGQGLGFWVLRRRGYSDWFSLLHSKDEARIARGIRVLGLGLGFRVRLQIPTSLYCGFNRGFRASA